MDTYTLIFDAKESNSDEIRLKFTDLVKDTINLIIFKYIDAEARIILDLNIRYIKNEDSYNICFNKYNYLRTCISNLITYYEFVSNKDRMENILENNLSISTNE